MVAVGVIALLLGSGNPVVETHRILSADMPFERVTGVSRSGAKWLVGGLRGLVLGKPGGPWQSASGQSVKQMLAAGEGTWVVYGNGAVDKVDLKTCQLYYDVLQAGAKRPWVASAYLSGKDVLLGGQGGWIVKSPSGLTETYPPELNGRPVTAIARTKGTLWVGTQDALFRQVGSKLTRFGFASGMPDVWVTAILPSEETVVVGLASGGLVRIVGDKAQAVPCPSLRVRLLYRWKGNLVLGALDGAWLRSGAEWQRLSDREATFVEEVDGELAIGSPGDIRFFR